VIGRWREKERRRGGAAILPAGKSLVSPGLIMGDPDHPHWEGGEKKSNLPAEGGEQKGDKNAGANFTEGTKGSGVTRYQSSQRPAGV